MKKSELRKLIRECIKEINIETPSQLTLAKIRFPEDVYELTFDEILPQDEDITEEDETWLKNTLGTSDNPKMFTPEEFLEVHGKWYNILFPDEWGGDSESIADILHYNIHKYKKINVQTAIEIMKLYWKMDDEEWEEEEFEDKYINMFSDPKYNFF